MARIITYATDSVIHDADKVIGTDGVEGANFGKTKNYPVSDLKTYINAGINLLGWARYDGTQSFSNGTEYDVLDGAFIDPAVSLVTNVLIDPWVNSVETKFQFGAADINSVYMLTVIFKASASNTSQTHLDISFVSGATDYERLGRSANFSKANNVAENFHEVFQFYVDADLVTYGLHPRIYADGGSIKVGDVIYFIQKTQSA